MIETGRYAFQVPCCCIAVVQRGSWTVYITFFLIIQFIPMLTRSTSCDAFSILREIGVDAILITRCTICFQTSVTGVACVVTW